MPHPAGPHGDVPASVRRQREGRTWARVFPVFPDRKQVGPRKQV